jgi:hypothetical protein
MSRALLALALLGATLLQGCAHLTTYQAGLGEPTTGVAMDAKQRMLLVNKAPSDPAGFRRMCAEPSPDVMAAVSASLSASLFGSAETAKAIAAGLSEGTQNIGLRTSSIQLMRDIMYRVCEGYLNDAYKDEGDYMSLQSQAQGLIVGLLAIEQLTGAMKADQGSIVLNSNAGGMPNADEQADRLTEAETAQGEVAKATDAALTTKKEADDALAATTAKIAAAGAAATAELKNQEKTQKADAEKAKRELDLLQTELKVADRRVTMAKEAYAKARSAVSAATSGKASFSASNRKTEWDAKSLATVATSVEKIVGRVIGRSEMERCFQLLVDAHGNPSATVQTFCNAAADTTFTKNRLRLAMQARNTGGRDLDEEAKRANEERARQPFVTPEPQRNPNANPSPGELRRVQPVPEGDTRRN